MIKVRNLTEGDLPILSRLYEDFWGEESSIDKMKEKFNKLKNNPSYIFLIATYNNIVAGSIMGIVCDELYGDCQPFMLMEDLIVDNDYRKKGIGKILLKSLESIGKERNCSQIIFITEKERTNTIKFYGSLGYNPDKHVGFKKSF